MLLFVGMNLISLSRGLILSIILTLASLNLQANSACRRALDNVITSKNSSSSTAASMLRAAIRELAVKQQVAAFHTPISDALAQHAESVDKIAKPLHVKDLRSEQMPGLAEGLILKTKENEPIFFRLASDGRYSGPHKLDRLLRQKNYD